MKRLVITFVALTAVAVASACFDGSGPAGPLQSGFANALPAPEDVELRVPGDPNPAALTVGDTAKFYADTYRITRSVNGTIYVILSVLRDVVRLPPSQVGEDVAMWGPFTPALEPATYLLAVSQVGPDQYEYALYARPRASQSDDDYVAVIEGESSPPAEGDVEGAGTFVFDWTAFAALNPLAELEGEMTVRYEHGQLQWRSVEMWFEGLRERRFADRDPVDVTYRYLENPDTSGDFQFAFLDDVHGPLQSRPELELFQTRSRWTAGGSGRADVRISGDEIAADLATYAGVEQSHVDASECWNDVFERTWYDMSPIRLSPDDGDTGEGEVDGPGQGDPASCAFADSLFADEDITLM